MMPCRWAWSSAPSRSRASESTAGMLRGPPRDRLLQPLAVDPVADPVGQVARHARVVHVPDGRMVELAQRLRLAQEPGAGWLVAEEVDAEADPPLERLVVGLEQHPVGVRRRRCAPAGSARPAPRGCGRTRRPARGRSSPEPPAALDAGVRPHAAASHQRRLPVGGVVGEEERAAVARAAADRDRRDRPASPRRSGRSPRAPPSGRSRREPEPPLAAHPGELLAAARCGRGAR